jgi:CRP-like cAMP-binding protein
MVIDESALPTLDATDLAALEPLGARRTVEPGEVLALPAEALRRVIATQPGLSDRILAAFMARRTVLLTGAASATWVVGSRFSQDSLSSGSSWPAAASPTSGWTRTPTRTWRASSGSSGSRPRSCRS